MPNAWAFPATARAIDPKPTSASVRPPSRCMSRPAMTSQSPSATASLYVVIFRSSASSIAIVWSDTSAMQ